MITVQCIDCQADCRIEQGEVGFVCEHCNCAQGFLVCGNCRAISQVPDSMSKWNCAECGAMNLGDANEEATATTYMADVDVDHDAEPRELPPPGDGIFNSTHGAPPRAASREVWIDGERMFTLPCPTCPAETTVEPDAKGFVCRGCGNMFVFARCGECGALSAEDDTLGPWYCVACGGLNESRDNGGRVWAEQFAESLTQADLAR